MLSTQYRLRLESICRCIANKEEVPLDDMIWAEKLAKAHTLARDWLQKARRQASQDIEEGSIDDFMNRMGLGDPDPSNHKTGFDGADEIVDWFQRDKPDDWRQRDWEDYSWDIWKNEWGVWGRRSCLPNQRSYARRNRWVEATWLISKFPGGHSTKLQMNWMARWDTSLVWIVMVESTNEL